MCHHRPCRRSCLLPLAASSWQGGGNSSTSLGEGGGGVQPPPNEVHDAIMYRVMQYTREESRWMEERMEKKMEAGQERMESLFRDLITGQEEMREGLEKKMEAQAQDSKAGQEKMEVLEKLGIGTIAFLLAQQGGLFSSLWASIKPLLP